MKKAKKAKVIKTKYVSHTLIVVCPHCKTECHGGFNEQHLRILCSYCENPIDLIHDEA